jgi:dienelactone hydrolase
MNHQKNILIEGKHNKPVVADLFYNGSLTKQPIVIFAHGFKGFKDWGPYDIIAEHFVKAGFAFVKFNFSHNGTTPENPTAFADLDAFGNNNFTKELDDLHVLLDWVHQHPLKEKFDLTSISLTGHSRGGGVAILKAAEDDRIKKLSTWASPIEFSKYVSPEQVDMWRQMGVIYIENYRTKEKMPLYFQLAEDVLQNRERLDIQRAVKQLKIPFLIVHGTKDETVEYNDALLMHSWNRNADLLVIENGNHSFGAEHPFDKNTLPKHYQQVVDETIAFFKR